MIISRRILGLACLTVAFALQGASSVAPFRSNSVPPSSAEDTVCGADKMLRMGDQQTSLRRMGSPVGLIQILNGAGGVAYCTGTMISPDLMITARHCAAPCRNLWVTFGYQGGGPQSMETFACKELVELGGESSYQDYMIVRLQGSPGTSWGWYAMAAQNLTPSQPLLIMHHPHGTPMKVSNQDCSFQYEAGGMIHHRCDTEPGSSGAAILAPDYAHPEYSRIVGIHTLGGCTTSASSTNQGPSMRQLAAQSNLIRSMLQ